MSKRKLSRQQAWRVEKIQAERAKRAARRDADAEKALQEGELGPEQEGLIVAHYGSQVAVESAPGESVRCHMRANLDNLVTGDQVIWCAGEPTGVVVAQLARNSELARPDSHGGMKTVAANIDQILVVIAPYPEPHANLIDRYLVASEALGIEPVIVLNKCDLLQAEPELDAAMATLLDLYPSIGYRVLRTSNTEAGIDALRRALQGRTSIFVGQSGVGKSSLVNMLLPEAQLRVGALSENRQKGTHTTTTAQLFHLDAGGRLIDSPGIREFGLWHLDRPQVEQGFPEFRPFLGNCRFRNCQHEGEPDCALLAAVEEGQINPRRLASYRHIIEELAQAQS